jgi:hypothetical protein
MKKVDKNSKNNLKKVAKPLKKGEVEEPEIEYISSLNQ